MASINIKALTIIMSFEKAFKKMKKRDRLEMNKMQGQFAEGLHVITRREQGYDVKRTGTGSDFVVQRMDIFGRKRGPKRYEEVKSGKAKQSKLQKKAQGKTKRYRVVRY